jgi:hypothetical protein
LAKGKKYAGSQPEEGYQPANRKNLHLDKPMMIGGWPEGEYEPLPHVKIADYLQSMGLLELRLLIREELKKRRTKKKTSLPPLEPIPSTVAFEREMRDVIASHYAGEDIESWLANDLFGSDVSPHGLARKSGYSGDEDLYRKPAASYIAQHLAANRDPEIRAIGQRLLQKLQQALGGRFRYMGSKDIEDLD